MVTFLMLLYSISACYQNKHCKSTKASSVLSLPLLKYRLVIAIVNMFPSVSFSEPKN